MVVGSIKILASDKPSGNNTRETKININKIKKRKMSLLIFQLR